MDFAAYQHESKKTAIHPGTGDNLPYLAIAMSEEVGEVSGKIKRWWREEEKTSVKDLSVEDKESLMYEVGDVLWHLAQFATECGYELEDVARMNIEKIHSRQKRGKLYGTGDNR